MTNPLHAVQMPGARRPGRGLATPRSRTWALAQVQAKPVRARAGSCCGRSTSWAWPISALTPSSTSSSPERRWRSSTSWAWRPWPSPWSPPVSWHRTKLPAWPPGPVTWLPGLRVRVHRRLGPQRPARL